MEGEPSRGEAQGSGEPRDAARDQIRQLEARVRMLETQLGRRRESGPELDEFFRRSFEDAPIGMALIGLDERIVEANAALCRMLGYSREQLLELTVTQITDPRDRALEVQPKRDMGEGRAMSFVVEKRYRRAGGGVLLGRMTVTALYDEDAKPVYYLGHLENVSRERGAERALRQREALLGALVQNTIEIFCVVSREGRLSFISPNVEQRLGYVAVELLDQELASLVYEEDREAYESALTEVLCEPSQELYLSVRLRSSSGELRWFEIVGHNRVEVEALSGVVMTMRDVTEQRAMQAQLDQAQRLDSLGRLAGGVAHDFNNMLSVILGMTELLAEGFEADDVRREDLATIEDTALRASELTRKLLLFGRRKLDTSAAIDVHEQLRSSRGLLEKVLGDDVELALALEASHTHVLIGAAELEQVVLNFATNARDAMAAGGRFRLSTHSRKLEEPQPPLLPGRYLELVAEDSGSGMPASVREQIFDPFFSTKATGRGTGLGLATVYGIIREAQGDIRVESEPGVGTRFVVLLPEHGAQQRESEESKPRARGRGARVLMVEDEANVRMVLERVLKHAGYRVSSCEGPEQALALVEEGLEFQLLLTDVVMPKISGAELHERIVEQRGQTPVVFISGYAKALDSELREHPGFLAKPFTPEGLLAKVNEQLGRS